LVVKELKLAEVNGSYQNGEWKIFSYVLIIISEL